MSDYENAPRGPRLFSDQWLADTVRLGHRPDLFVDLLSLMEQFAPGADDTLCPMHPMVAAMMDADLFCPWVNSYSSDDEMVRTTSLAVYRFAEAENRAAELAHPPALPRPSAREWRAKRTAYLAYGLFAFCESLIAPNDRLRKASLDGVETMLSFVHGLDHAEASDAV